MQMLDRHHTILEHIESNSFNNTSSEFKKPTCD